MAGSQAMSLPDMAVRPPWAVQNLVYDKAVPGKSFLGSSSFKKAGILKSSSLPALERPPSSMFSGGLPPGAADFQASPDPTFLRPRGLNSRGLPSTNDLMDRPGTTQCSNWLDSSMGFRFGHKVPPSSSETNAPTSPTSIGVESRPKPTAIPSVSLALEQWPAKTAAKARMSSLKHFTATPPRPISRSRQPLPSLRLTGQFGGQSFYAEDWHYGTHGHKQDKRMRHDFIAGDRPAR